MAYWQCFSFGFVAVVEAVSSFLGICLIYWIRNDPIRIDWNEVGVIRIGWNKVGVIRIGWNEVGVIRIGWNEVGVIRIGWNEVGVIRIGWNEDVVANSFLEICSLICLIPNAPNHADPFPEICLWIYWIRIDPTQIGWIEVADY
jgi:hypothetical protein